MHLLTFFVDPAMLAQIEDGIKKEIEVVGRLDKFASQYPYYK